MEVFKIIHTMLDASVIEKVVVVPVDTIAFNRSISVAVKDIEVLGLDSKR